jgi:hypothetical protein
MTLILVLVVFALLVAGVFILLTVLRTREELKDLKERVSGLEPEKARETLARAGLSDEQVLEILVTDDSKKSQGQGG